MDNRRIWINVFVPLGVLFLKWVIGFCGHRIKPTVLDVATADFDFKKTLGMLGWDFAGVGLGFYLSSILISDSVLARLAENDRAAQNLVLLASFTVVMIGYSAIVYVRFSLLEPWASLPNAHRFAYGLLNLVLGVGLMAGTSKLALKSPSNSKLVDFAPAGAVTAGFPVKNDIDTSGKKQ